MNLKNVLFMQDNKPTVLEAYVVSLAKESHTAHEATSVAVRLKEAGATKEEAAEILKKSADVINEQAIQDAWDPNYHHHHGH